MYKGRRKYMKGFALVVASFFMMTQVAFAGLPTYTSTPEILPEYEDPLLEFDATKRNQTEDGTKQLEANILADEGAPQVLLAEEGEEDQDTITHIIIELVIRLFNNEAQVLKQIVTSEVLDLITGRGTVSEQISINSYNADGSLRSVRGTNESRTVSSDGVLGLPGEDFSICQEDGCADVVIESSGTTKFEISFGQSVFVESTTNTEENDNLNMTNTRSRQTIIFNHENGIYTDGTGEFTSTSRNINWIIDDETGEIIGTRLGSEEMTRTEGQIFFEAAIAANEMNAVRTESVSITTDALANTVRADVSVQENSFDAWGRAVVDPETGLVESRANTYSIQVSRREGNFSMRDLTELDSEGSFAGVAAFQQIAGPVDEEGNYDPEGDYRGPVFDPDTGAIIDNSSIEEMDLLVQALTSDRVNDYTVSHSKVTFGAVDRKGNTLATANDVHTIGRDFSDEDGHTFTAGDQHIDIVYVNHGTAEDPVYSGRILDQTGTGTSFTAQYDKSDGSRLSWSLTDSTLDFDVTSRNTAVLVSNLAETVSRNDRDKEEVRSSALTTFTYDDVYLTGGDTIVYSETQATDAPPDEPLDNSSSFTWVEYVVIANQAYAAKTTTVALSNDYTDTAGNGLQTATWTVAVNAFDASSSRGKKLLEGTSITTEQNPEYRNLSGDTPITPADLLAAYYDHFGSEAPAPPTFPDLPDWP